MSHVSLPHTIDNGAGERLTFLAIEALPEGPTVLLEAEVQPGAGPAMHVHYRQVEELSVTSGRLGYQLFGERERFAEVGESARFEAGVPHRFWADGADVLRMTGWVRPPDNFVWFLSEIYRSTRDAGSGRPDDFDAAYLLGRYRHEYGMPSIPAPVRALVFPMLRVVGRGLGRFDRFAGAPDPLPPRQATAARNA